jgi:hypothetical protein
MTITPFEYCFRSMLLIPAKLLLLHLPACCQRPLETTIINVMIMKCPNIQEFATLALGWDAFSTCRSDGPPFAREAAKKIRRPTAV